jgi:hypothetical protein
LTAKKHFKIKNFMGVEALEAKRHAAPITHTPRVDWANHNLQLHPRQKKTSGAAFKEQQLNLQMVQKKHRAITDVGLFAAAKKKMAG